MMYADFLLKKFIERFSDEAIAWSGKTYTYGWLSEKVTDWNKILESEQIHPGDTVAIEADFTPNSIALFLALIGRGCISIPLTSTVDEKKSRFIEIAQAKVSISIGKSDQHNFTHLKYEPDHDLYANLIHDGRPGLVLFTSGSTGESKAAVHDMSRILEKFKVSRHRFRTISFLLYDHIGGVNTLLYTLSNAGFLVTLSDRRPETVMEVIEKYGIELLPTSPTFINLILLSDAWKQYDLSSLKIVTYGTEPMPESTLLKFNELFPQVRLQQTYGLTEVGILRSKSESSDSLWVKVGGEDFETRVIDGKLQIKARSAMLGYLNAPSPFTEDGWFDTGDIVEKKGEYIRFLGRDSEIINVGGEKVFPAEVESVIQEMDNVLEASVSGVANPITGQIVVAEVVLLEGEELPEFRKRMRSHCRNKLAPYKIPQKIVLSDKSLHTQRFKKIRGEV